MPVATAEPWASTIAASGATSARPPERRTTSSTPSQSYVSSSRIPSATECGSAHGVISSTQRAPGIVDGRSGGERPRERRTSGGLHGVEPHPDAEPPASARGERPAADLHDDAVEVHASIGELPPDRAPAVEAQCVLRALHAERHGRRRPRPPGTAAPPDRPGGSADRRSHGWMLAPSALEQHRARTVKPTSGRTRRAATPPAGRASPRRSLRCRTMRWRAAGAAPLASRSDSAATRCSRIVTRCRPLWLPPTLPVSSFTQTSAPSAVRQRRRAGERRDCEAVGELPREGGARRFRHARASGRTPTRRGAARSARTGWGRRAATADGPTSRGCSTWWRSAGVARGHVKG